MNKTIDITGLTDWQKEKISELVKDMTETNRQIEELAKPPAPEKWTVERVCENVSPVFHVGEVGDIGFGDKDFYNFEKDLNNVPTEQDAQKVLAFCQLLTCAHWANENSLMEPEHEGYGWKWTRHDLYLPLYFRNLNAYDRFMSIEGIEPLLKTFFGITD